MSNYVLIHSYQLPTGKIMESKYPVIRIDDHVVETKELGVIPRNYITTDKDNIIVLNNSTFVLEDLDTEKRVSQLMHMKECMVKLLKIRKGYTDEIEEIKSKVAKVDSEIKKLSKDMKIVSEGGSIDA